MNVVRFFELMRGKRANSIGEEIIIIIQLIVIWGLILSFGYIAISDATISEFFSIIPKVVSGIFWGSILGYVFLVLTACLVIVRLRRFLGRQKSHNRGIRFFNISDGMKKFTHLSDEKVQSEYFRIADIKSKSDQEIQDWMALKNIMEDRGLF